MDSLSLSLCSECGTYIPPATGELRQNEKGQAEAVCNGCLDLADTIQPQLVNQTTRALPQPPNTSQGESQTGTEARTVATSEIYG